MSKGNASTHHPRRFRVLVIDDHPLVRAGLAQMIKFEEDFELCGEAGDSESGLKAITDLCPDITILDIALRGTSGIDLLNELRIRGINTPVLILSMHDEVHYAERALRAGARGYVMKEAAHDTILDAMRQVLTGDIYLSKRMRARALKRFAEGPDLTDALGIDRLSDRELEVFTLIGNGHTTREIAKLLHLSSKTIEAHRERIKQKLGLRSATQLLQQATLFTQSH